MQMNNKAFKISELPLIQNIDGNDLLIVSDREQGKFYTKQMTIQQLFSLFLQRIVADQQLLDIVNQAAQSAVSQAVDDRVQEIAAQAAADAVSSAAIPEKVIETIESNSSLVLDILDGQRNNAFTLDAN